MTHLEALVEHSLVVAEPTGRLRLLEPVAQYARDLLEDAGEWDEAARAHAAHYLAVAEANHSSYRDGGQVAALTRIDLEHANLNAAAERSLAVGDVETPARMAWELWLYWWLRGHHDHGRRFAETALAARPRPARRRARPRRARPPRRWPSRWTTSQRPAGGGGAPTSTPATTRAILSNAVAGEGLVGTRRRRPRPGPRPLRAGHAPCRGRRPRGPVDLGAGPRLARARSRCSRATPTRPYGSSRPASSRPGAARTGCRPTSRSTTSSRSSSAAATTPPPAATSRRAPGSRWRRATRPTSPTSSTPAPCWPPRPGSTPACRCCSGPRRRSGRRSARAATATTGPTPPPSMLPRPTPVRHLGADRYDDALDTGRGLVAHRRRRDAAAT